MQDFLEYAQSSLGSSNDQHTAISANRHFTRIFFYMLNQTLRQGWITEK
jgi:hypothetical protein